MMVVIPVEGGMRVSRADRRGVRNARPTRAACGTEIGKIAMVNASRATMMVPISRKGETLLFVMIGCVMDGWKTRYGHGGHPSGWRTGSAA